MKIDFKKINIINLLAIICIVLVVLASGLYFFNKKNLNRGAVQNEAQNNKEQNKNTLNNAARTNIKPVRPIDGKDHMMGDSKAPVQLIVYSDFECPFSLKYTDILKKTKEEFGDKVVIAFRHYPLLSHDNAVPAAIASECANEQGKFWEMHDRIFVAAKNNALNSGQYKKDARSIGLDEIKFNKCVDMESYKNEISLMQLEAKEFGVNGTPASFINSDPIPGAVPFEDYVDSIGESQKGMKSLIEDRLKK